ncbi:15151_t:CDS:2, partial [Cetraspora pellucida]
QATIDPCIINKVLNIVQNNSAKLNHFSRKHAKLKYLIKEQQTQLEEKQLNKMLESDKEYAEQLQKLNNKGVLFNVFWNIKLYSEVIFAAIQLKKDYYIQYMKEEL